MTRNDNNAQNSLFYQDELDSMMNGLLNDNTETDDNPQENTATDIQNLVKPQYPDDGKDYFLRDKQKFIENSIGKIPDEDELFTFFLE